MNDVAGIITAMAALVIAITGLYTAVAAAKIKAGVADVHSEVKTANGITMAVLADRAEGRRIEVDVAHGDRTESEQGYVDKLHGPEDEHGNPLVP